MTAPVIPAGSADLADRLDVWRGVINAKLSGGKKTKTADQSKTNDASFTATPDAHLSVPVLANTVYSVEVHGIYQAGATGQIKFDMTFPSGTMEGGSWEYDAGTDAGGAVNWAANASMAQTSPAAFVAGLVGTGANVPFRLTGSLHVGVTGGSLLLRWAQNVSNGTATILRKGTWMRVVADT